MLPVVSVMVASLVLAGLVLLYVAYPHRGQDVPRARWVSRAMHRGVERLPTLDNRVPEKQDH